MIMYRSIIYQFKITPNRRQWNTKILPSNIVIVIIVLKGTHGKREKILISTGPSKTVLKWFFMIARSGSELKKVIFALPHFFHAHRRVYGGRASTLHAHRLIYPELMDQKYRWGKGKNQCFELGTIKNLHKICFYVSCDHPVLFWSIFHQNSVSPCVPLIHLYLIQRNRQKS